MLFVLICGPVYCTGLSATEGPVDEESDYYILTPPPSPTPRINGASIFGVRPGSPFLFTIAATGTPPLHYEVRGLPKGLRVDADTGRITGVIEDRTFRTYEAKVVVSNAVGMASRGLRIVVGNDIALTPPMGWNSWNCWAREVDAEKLLKTARAMAERLKPHGWTYINVDDSWQGRRGGPLMAIQPNAKFPDMKAVVDEVHRLGLKFGLYSSPWVTSYAGYNGGSADTPDGAWVKPRNREESLPFRRPGAFSFHEQDAMQWSEWGVDYLKYDWYPNDLPTVWLMAGALRRRSRDIVYSISNTTPFELATDIAQYANAWRTSSDMGDFWETDDILKPKGYSGLLDIWNNEERWHQSCRPGHWPDPDMLVVGQVGWGTGLRPSRLTADEQYTHISLWCLWSAPLLIGCPIESMDEFTFALLSNDEVLAVNQDAMGRRAVTIIDHDGVRVLVKPLEDGSIAVGLFNLSDEEASVTAPFSRLGVKGGQTVRDLWRQKDLGVFTDRFTAKVPSHGVVLVKITNSPIRGQVSANMRSQTEGMPAEPRFEVGANPGSFARNSEVLPVVQPPFSESKRVTGVNS